MELIEVLMASTNQFVTKIIQPEQERLQVMTIDLENSLNLQPFVIGAVSFTVTADSEI